MTPLPQNKNAIRYVLIGLSLAALGILMWRVGEIFVIAFGGLVLAAALRSLSDPLAKWTGLSAGWSLTVVVGGVMVVVLLLGWLFGSQASHQFDELRQLLPQAMAKFEAWVQSLPLGREGLELVKKSTADSKLLANLGLAASAVLASAANLFLIIFLGIYVAADPGLYRTGFLRLLPLTRRNDVGLALDNAATALQRWLLGQMIAMVVIGVVLGLGLAVIGMPQAFALGVLMGICEFVPVAGPIVAAIPGILFAFTKSPQMALYVLIVYVVVQQLESNLLIPLIQRWATRLAPAIGLLAVVVFGILFGLLGIIFATPITVVVISLVKNLYVEDALEDHPRPPASSRRAR